MTAILDIEVSPAGGLYPSSPYFEGRFIHYKSCGPTGRTKPAKERRKVKDRSKIKAARKAKHRK